MRCIRGKAPKLLEGTLEPGQGFINHPSEMAEFIARVLDIQTLTQPFGGDLFGAASHRSNGRSARRATA